jgi:hypothetical protein
MDASDLLLTQWVRQVKQIWSEMHQYRQESFALAIFGIVLAGQAVMQRVAEILYERLSDPCKMTSYERRLQRLIDNEKFPVTPTWERFLQHTLPYWDKRHALLVLDCTPYNETFTIVFVGILVQKRLLPRAGGNYASNREVGAEPMADCGPPLCPSCQLFARSPRHASGRSGIDSLAIDPALRALSVALHLADAE